MGWLRKVASAAGVSAAGAALSISAYGLPATAQGDSAAASAPADAAPPAPPAPRPLSEKVEVSVNDDVISSYDVIQRMRLLIVTSGIQPTDDNLTEIQREAVRSLIDERLEMQELRRESKSQKFDLIANDAEVDQEVGDIARSNNMSAEQLLASLAAQGVGAETLRDQLRAEISWRGWIRGRYGSRLSVGEDQIKAYQQRLQAQASRAQYQISEVYVDAARVGGMDKAMAGAAQLLGELQKGAPFAAIARNFSTSPTAANGGDVGWISAGEMPPEVDAALDQLRAGQLSTPIQTKDGVYIIFLRDRRAGGSATVVSLKQAAIGLPRDASDDVVAAARAKLEGLRAKLNGCDNLEVQAAKIEGVVASDMGEAETKDLAPAFREAAETLPAGQVSEPIRSDAGLHLVAVCNKHAAGAEQVNRDEIENRMVGQQLSMIAKRYLRDLRNSATIETR